MCGLFGVIGFISAKEMEVFERLAHVSVFRGSHSTGIAVVKKDDSVSVYKKPVPTYDFMEMAETKRLLQNPYSIKCIIGHARFATVGAKNSANAHPFEFDNIVGAHNGTIDRHCITQYLDKTSKYGTDSEAIFSKLNDEEFEDVIPNLEGAWAITAWDKQNKVLNIIRNDKRELYCLYSKDKKTVFWASEMDMLRFAVSSAKYEAELDKKGECRILYFTDNLLYNIETDCTMEHGGKLESKKRYFPSYSPPANHAGAAQTHRPYSYHDTNRDNRETRTGNTDYTTINKTSSPNVSNVRPKELTYIKALISPMTDKDTGRVLYKGLDNKFFDHDDFVKNYDQECQLCGGAIEYNVGMLITKEEPFKPICHHCVEKETVLLDLVEQV